MRREGRRCGLRVRRRGRVHRQSSRRPHLRRMARRQPAHSACSRVPARQRSHPWTPLPRRRRIPRNTATLTARFRGRSEPCSAQRTCRPRSARRTPGPWDSRPVCNSVAHLGSDQRAHRFSVPWQRSPGTLLRRHNPNPMYTCRRRRRSLLRPGRRIPRSQGKDAALRTASCTALASTRTQPCTFFLVAPGTSLGNSRRARPRRPARTGALSVQGAAAGNWSPQDTRSRRGSICSSIRNMRCHPPVPARTSCGRGIYAPSCT